LEARGKDARALGRARIGAVGPATAEALAERRLRADLVAAPDKARGDGLVDTLAPHGIRGKRFLLPRAEKGRETVPDAIRAAGGACDVVDAYRNVMPPEAAASDALARVRRGEADVLVFFSPSAVKRLVEVCGGSAPLSAAVVAAVGPVTAAACRRAGLDVHVESEEASAGALVDALAAHLAKERI
jgi:uroporphyrinogen III methyltransferase/synthase